MICVLFNPDSNLSNSVGFRNYNKMKKISLNLSVFPKFSCVKSIYMHRNLQLPEVVERVKTQYACEVIDSLGCFSR